MVKLGISGAAGRMGARIIELAQKDESLSIVFGLEAKNNPIIGKTKQNIVMTEDPAQIEDCDCLIEFTEAGATVEHLGYLIRYKKAAVIGTTGLSSDEQTKIKEASQFVPIVFSPNMSVGVNLLFRLVGEAAKIMKGYDVMVEEAHHIHKKDAPSGTAKKIGEILNRENFNLRIEDIMAVREGEIVGDHKVIFESEVDRIELFHSAKTRDVFAQGALSAARWVVNRSSGLYSMADVLFR